MQTITEDTGGGRFARQLLRLLGPAYQAPDDTPSAAWWLSLGDGMEALRAALEAAMSEAFVSRATQEIGTWEEIYGLSGAPGLSLNERRARLLAKVQARRDGSPQGIVRALAQLEQVVVKVHELLLDEVPQSGDYALDTSWWWGAQRDVFLVGIELKPGLYGKWAVIAAAIIAQMIPTHVEFVVHTNDPYFTPFLCDSPDHLTDRDVVGYCGEAVLTTDEGFSLYSDDGRALVTG